MAMRAMRGAHQGDRGDGTDGGGGKREEEGRKEVCCTAGRAGQAGIEGSIQGPRRPKRWNSFSALKFKIADLLSVAML